MNKTIFFFRYLLSATLLGWGGEEYKIKMKGFEKYIRIDVFF